MATVKVPDHAGVGKERSRMDQVLAPLAFLVFAILWAAFAVALVASQGSLDATWDWIRSLPLVLQVIVWLLLLPVVAGLWVWHTDWTLAIRLVVIAGIAVANLYVFFPRGVFGLKP